MKIIKCFYLSFTALIFTCIRTQPLCAQALEGRALADSLIQELPKTKNDTDQVKLIVKAARALSQIDPAAAMHYADSGIQLSTQRKWKKGIGLAYMSKSRIYRVTSDYAAGLENAGKAYEVFDSLNWKPGMADALSETSNHYERLANYSKAIENNFKALGIYEGLGLDINIAWIYNNIGVDYYRLSDYPKAIENYNKSLKFFKKTNNKYGIASALDNIASVYEEQGEFKQVNDYNLQAIKLFEEIDDEPAMGRIYINRGNFLKDRTNFDSALIFYKKAIKIAQKLGVKTTLAFGNGGIGEVYFNLAKNRAGKYSIPDSLKMSRTMLLQKAHDYFSRALEFSKKAGDLSLMMEYTGFLSETETLQGNYKAALNSYKQSTQYKDSIFNDDNKTKIAALENQRLTEVKDKEIQLLNKENALQASEQGKKNTEAKRVKNIQYFIIAALGIVVLAAVIIALIQFRNSKQKQKVNALLRNQKEKVESTLTELKSTQAQLIQSEKMASLGELTAGIAHEIQNPLNFINNFSEVNTELIAEMKNELLSNNNEEAISIANHIEENEEKISHHGKRADAIVKGMLQHSRMSTGQKELTDINALAEQYIRLSYQGIRAKDKYFKATIQTVFDPGIEKINIVSQDIGRVLLNIYNNAFYAVQEKKKTAEETYEPTVLIFTKNAEDKIEIHIKDNGNGIPQKILDKIFQPFYTTKPAGEGTGLGLSLSYDIIKTHGGEIKLKTKEGEGSEFIIELPDKKIG